MVASCLLCLSCRDAPSLPPWLAHILLPRLSINQTLSYHPKNRQRCSSSASACTQPVAVGHPWSCPWRGRGMQLLKGSNNSAKPWSSRAGNTLTMRNQSPRFGVGGFNLLPSLLLGPHGWGTGAWEVGAEPRTAAKSSLSCNWGNWRDLGANPQQTALLFIGGKKKREKTVLQESMFSLGNTLPQSLEDLVFSFHVHLHCLASRDAQMFFGVTKSRPPITDGL